MSGFVAVCAEAELLADGRRTVALDGRPVALFVVEGRIYAIDDACPHRGGPLGQGDLQGHLVHCPLHAWCFDVRSGLSPVYTMARVATREVRVRDGKVLVSTEAKLSPLPESE